MSKIDQAFIQAYAPDDPPAVPFVPQIAISPASPPTPAVASTNTEASGETQTNIRPPHFSTAGSENVRAEVAAFQRATISQNSFSTQAPRQSDRASEQRRPLSSFVAEQPSADNSFRPALEVDGFRWPKVTTDILENHPEQLVPVAEQLLVGGESGRTMVGIVGTRQGVGSTTVMLCLARLLASADKAVALVDADFMNYSLAEQLGLQIETGWEEVLDGQVPLAESVVHSLEDNVSLLPLSGAASFDTETLAGIQTSVSAGVLRYHYDIVLVDLGIAIEQSQWIAAQNVVHHCRVDTSIIVADTLPNDGTNDESVNYLLQLLGSTCLGLIGNEAIS